MRQTCALVVVCWGLLMGCGGGSKGNDADSGTDGGTDGGSAVLGLSAATHDFGSTMVGGAAPTTTFTVTNSGTAASGTLTSTLGGAGAASFALSSDGCVGKSLAAGATCDVVVKFMPAAVGAQVATLTVTGTPGGSVSATLTGTATPASTIAVSPTAKAYGDVTVGTSSSSTTFTLTNNGSSATGTMTASLTGTDKTEFFLSSDSCSGGQLASNSSCTVKVRFSPTTGGQKSASLTVTATPGGTATAMLSGNGLVPPLTISPTTHDYGTVAIGVATGEIPFTITNNSTVAAGPLSVDLSRRNAYHLGVNTCTGMLAVGATCVVGVVFQPDSPGGRNGSLTVSGTVGGDVSAALIGTGSAVLPVVKAGAGSGTVTSTPAGIACGATCAAPFTTFSVTLTAVPDAGFGFAGWSGGGCSGSGDCMVNMDAAKTVTATFQPTRLVTVVVAGGGTVTSTPSGITCGSDCSELYALGQSVTLTPTPDAMNAFQGWSGAPGCVGTGSCTLVVDAARTVTATFQGINLLTVVRAGTGSGSVNAVPGIICGSDCSEAYFTGTSVTLTATPADVDNTFAGWSGVPACSTGPTCTVTMDQARSVTATFNGEPARWRPVNNGLWGGDVYAMVAHPTNPSIAYAGTTDGIYVTTDAGASWTQLPGPLRARQVYGLAIQANNPLILHAGWANGFMRSADGGQTWTAATAPSAAGGRITIDPSNPMIVWAVSDTVVKSVDGGLSYAAVAGAPTSVYMVAVHPTDSMKVYASAQTGGFFRSLDGGATWNASNMGVTGTTGGQAIAIDPVTPTTIYYGKGSFPDNGLFKSTDGGATWSASIAGNQFPYAVAIDPQNPSVVYFGGYQNGIFRSKDGGASWDNLALPDGDANNAVQTIAFAPSDPTRVWVGVAAGFGGGPGIYRSDDHALTWALANTGLTNTHVNALVIDPNAPGTLYTNVRQVSKTTNGGTSWSPIGGGLNEQLVEDVVIDPSSSSTLYLLNHYQGLYKATTGGAPWMRQPGWTNNDGTQIFIDPNSSQNLFITNGDDFYRSLDGGGAFTHMTQFPGPAVYSLDIVKQDSRIMWLATQGGLQKSVDAGATWMNMQSARCYAFAIDPSNASNLYCGETSTVYRSIDGGAHWSSTTAGLPSANGYKMLVDPRDPMVAYYATDAGVYRTSDGNATWTQVSRGLPNLRVISMVMDPTSSNTLYVGSDRGGVFKTTTGGR